MQHLRHLLDDGEESALSDDDAAARAAAHDRKQEIRVNFASCTPHAAACWGTGCAGWPKGLHNSFHLWQDINQCGQRAVASSRLASPPSACWEVVAKQRPSTMRVIYDFVNFLSAFIFCFSFRCCFIFIFLIVFFFLFLCVLGVHAKQVCCLSLLFFAAELLRNRT